MVGGICFPMFYLSGLVRILRYPSQFVWATKVEFMSLEERTLVFFYIIVSLLVISDDSLVPAHGSGSF